MTEKIEIHTSLGTMSFELFADQAPESVKNFLSYVDKGHYDGTVFHRVISGFMIQGGGFDEAGVQKPTAKPIVLESGNGLKNERGTLAMARTAVENSATCQFFINTRDNSFLNKSAGNAGYAVFAKLVAGEDVMDQIEAVRTGVRQGMRDWPLDEVVITSVKRVPL